LRKELQSLSQEQTRRSSMLKSYAS